MVEEDIDILTFHPNLISSHQIAEREPICFEVFSSGVLCVGNSNRLKYFWIQSEANTKPRSSSKSKNKNPPNQRFSLSKTHRFGELSIVAWNLAAFDPDHVLFVMYTSVAPRSSLNSYISFMKPSLEQPIKVPAEMNITTNAGKTVCFGRYLLIYTRNIVDVFSKESLYDEYRHFEEQADADPVDHLHSINTSSPIRCIGIFFQTQIWIGLDDGRIEVYTMQSNDVRDLLNPTTLRKHTHTVSSLCEWKKYVASSGDDATIAIWDSFGTIKLIGTGYIPSSHSVLCLVGWKDVLCTATFDNLVKCWNMEGDCVASVQVKKKIRYMKIWKRFLVTLDCTSLLTFYQDNREKWLDKAVLLLWLGWMKNAADECVIARLPVELVQFIIRFLVIDIHGL